LTFLNGYVPAAYCPTSIFFHISNKWIFRDFNLIKNNFIGKFYQIKERKKPAQFNFLFNLIKMAHLIFYSIQLPIKMAYGKEYNGEDYFDA